MNNGSNFDIGNMNNMLSLVKLLSSAQGNGNPPPTKSETELDHLVSDKKMNMIKASLPYVDGGNQKSLAILIKCMELKKTMTLYNGDGINELSEMDKSKGSKNDMLAAIRNYCSDSNKQMIDILLNMQKMKGMMATLNNPDLSYNDPQTNNQGMPDQQAPNEQNLDRNELIDKLKNLMQN